MAKPTIIKVWLAGLVVILVGAVLAGVSTLVWLAHVVSVTQNGADYVADSYFWTTVGFWWTCGIVASTGVILQASAWIGALVNTYRFAARTWFNVLLWFGIAGILTSPLFGLGAVAWMGVMVTYMIAGPDSTTVEAAPFGARAQPPTAAMTT